jgi:hypothetical protein
MGNLSGTRMKHYGNLPRVIATSTLAKKERICMNCNIL